MTPINNLHGFLLRSRHWSDEHSFQTVIFVAGPTCCSKTTHGVIFQLQILWILGCFVFVQFFYRWWVNYHFALLSLASGLAAIFRRIVMIHVIQLFSSRKLILYLSMLLHLYRPYSLYGYWHECLYINGLIQNLSVDLFGNHPPCKI